MCCVACRSWANKTLEEASECHLANVDFVALEVSECVLAHVDFVALQERLRKAHELEKHRRFNSNKTADEGPAMQDTKRRRRHVTPVYSDWKPWVAPLCDRLATSAAGGGDSNNSANVLQTSPGVPGHDGIQVLCATPK